MYLMLSRMKNFFGPIGKTFSEPSETHPTHVGTETMSAWESAKQNPRVVLFSLGACFNSALWGFDIGMRSPS